MRRIAFLLLFASSLWAEAQVKGVLFYSNRCPHCRYVIQDVLPPILEEYGDELEILFVNIGSPSGRKLYNRAVEWVPIEKERQGVPALLIGRTLLVGKREIPERIHAVVDKGLQGGGVRNMISVAGLAPPMTTDIYAVIEGQPTIMDNLAHDPIGATIAILTLAFMVYSLIHLGFLFWQRGIPRQAPTGWRFWTIGALALFGLCTSLYLTLAHTTGSKLFCGPIGDCDAVQHSPYAYVLGIFPVSALGLLGYLGILALWLWQRISSYQRPLIHTILTLSIFFGVQFSAYLTFLEPFVIGATCIWCILSALSLTALLWLVGTPCSVSMCQK